MATGVFISHSFKPLIGGAEEHAHQLARFLTERGEDITVVAERHDAVVTSGFDSSTSYRVKRVHSARFMPAPRRNAFAYALELLAFAGSSFMLFARVVKLLLVTRPDYILMGYNQRIALSLAMRLGGALLGGVPRIVFLHHMLRNAVSGGHPVVAGGRLEWWGLRCGSVIVCVSEAAREDVVAMGIAPRERTRVLYNGIDHAAINAWRNSNAACRLPLERPHTNAPIIITVSSLKKAKGIQRVIKAMPYVRSKVPGARYVVVGDGYYRGELEDMARRSPAASAIEFRGALYADDKWATYAAADLFVLPTEQEGFGVVFLEAAAFGLPSVGTRVAAVPEAVMDGRTGLLVGLDDERGLAAALVKLLQDDQLRRAMGYRAHKHAERFTWDAVATQVLALARGGGTW